MTISEQNKHEAEKLEKSELPINQYKELENGR